MPVTIVGNNTPTAGGVVYGDGTNYASTAAGTSGQVLTSAGAGAPTWATPGGGFSTMQIFTSSGTFTIPAGKTTVKVTVVGGGGGGGGANTNSNYSGGGGGGGATGISYLSGLTPGNTIVVTVGAGGSSGSPGGSGTAGGNSSVASGTQTITTITANGGANGWANGNGGGLGGTASGATLNIRGSAAFGVMQGSNIAVAINGGSSAFGGGGGYDASLGTPTVGGNYGGGGGGGVFGSSGAAGAGGVVIFEY